MLLPRPGARMEAILSLVPPASLVAEIGADHGILSAHLLAAGVAERMIVADISAASLNKARRLFALHEIEERAAFRVADGLHAIAGEAVGGVVVAGMGGKTIIRMLDTGAHWAKDAALILQPNGDPAPLRHWLMEHGYRIEAERLAREDRRYYIALRAVPGEAHYQPQELLIGPCLLRENPPLLKDYLAWRMACLARAQGEAAQSTLAAMKSLQSDMDAVQL
ncbi:MAG: class I SAM-dependent methyltransferase [Oscillospiraceae bacterium]|jgi:tRNA (adenine22-N1)-methyltransferase|nr:class I SAM-dependent methyltransferase [Oscillospiraceae bacterium]